jgi:uncharacterized iron-regulated membrane protein
MACMLVAALTGIWLTFRVELDGVVNPHLRHVQPARSRVSLAAIVENVERQYPEALVQALILPERADDSAGVYLRSRDGERLPVDQVFVNPYTGALLGARSTTRIAFTKESLDPTIDRLHYSLLMDEFGLWLMGGVAGIWLITGIVGVALAWPSGWLRVSRWRPVLSARFHRGPYKANYELHRAVGVWFLPLLILLAFTSLYQNLPQFVRPVVSVFSPLAERPPGQPVPPGAPIVTPDHALASLSARVPGARASSIGRDFSAGRYSIVFHLPGDLSPQGDNRAFVDLTSGDVTALRVATALSAGDQFLTWIFPLHTGTAFGLPGRIAVAMGGLALVVLMATGFVVWGRKWQMRRRAKPAAARVQPGY